MLDKLRLEAHIGGKPTFDNLTDLQLQDKLWVEAHKDKKTTVVSLIDRLTDQL